MIVGISGFFLLIDLVLRNGHIGRDAGGWSYVGWLWAKYGQPPYIGAVDAKTPGIHYLYALSIHYFGNGVLIHAVLGIAMFIGTTILVYFIAARMYNPEAGLLASVLCSLTFCWPLLDGPTYTEPFLVFFVTLAIALVLLARESATSSFVKAGGLLTLAGFFLAFGVAFKQIGIVDLPVLFGAWVIPEMLPKERRWSIRRLGIGSILIVIGFIAGTVASVVPLLVAHGSISSYVEIAWGILLGEGRPSAGILLRIHNVLQVWGTTKAMFFFPLVFLFVVKRHELQEEGVPWRTITVWLCADFLGANASGNLWGHQLQQAVPSASVAGGIVLSSLLTSLSQRYAHRNSRNRISIGVCLFLFFMWLPYGTVLTAGTRWVRGVSSQQSPSVEVGAWLASHVSPKELTYVYGRSAGEVLFYARRRSASRHFNNHHIKDKRVDSELRADLNMQSPKIVLVDERARPVPPKWFERFLSEDYKPGGKIDGYLVFLRQAQDNGRITGVGK